MTPPTIALATYDAQPALAPDDRLLADALRAVGIQSVPAVWSDGAVDWAAFDAVLLRSTWDYHLRPAEFARWLDALEKAGVRLWNSAAIARWNMDKRYLDDLAALDVPVVPSARLTRRTSHDLAALLARQGWAEAVVKPAVSANAHATWRVRAGGAAARQDTLEAMLAAGDVIVQPFVDAVRTHGEWSLVFFRGLFSHAVLKRPAEGEFRVQERMGGRAALASAEPAVLRAAAEVLARLPDPGLYARVDGVVTPRGWMLMELEMLEPSLFFALHPPAARRLAEIVRDLLRGVAPAADAPTSLELGAGA